MPEHISGKCGEYAGYVSAFKPLEGPDMVALRVEHKGKEIANLSFDNALDAETGFAAAVARHQAWIKSVGESP